MADNYTLKRGDSFYGALVLCEVYNVDELGIETKDEIFDFTGFQVFMQLRKSENDISVVYDFTPNANTTTLGQMTIPISIPSSVTKNFEKGIYKGDIEIVRVNPIYPNQTVYDFTISVNLDVSQANIQV